MKHELISFRENQCSLSSRIKRLIEDSLISAATINQLNDQLYSHKITSPSAPVEKGPPPSNCYCTNQNSNSTSSHANNLVLVPGSAHYSPQPTFNEVTKIWML